jgi:hypothetical protein
MNVLGIAPIPNERKITNIVYEVISPVNNKICQ